MDNKNAFVIWGSSGHAKVISDVIAEQGGSVALLVDNNPAAEASLFGVPLVFGIDSLRNWLDCQQDARSYRAAIAIGGKLGADRRSIAAQLLELGLELPPLIHRSAVVSPSASIGDGSHVLANAVIAADASLGSCCIVNNSANVDHECLIGNGVHIAPGATLCGCVLVDENAMIGAGAVILPRCRIGKNARVGAGSVIIRDVPENLVVAGNPAREIGREQ